MNLYYRDKYIECVLRIDGMTTLAKLLRYSDHISHEQNDKDTMNTPIMNYK